jgi:multidrug efflux pump subunit AcrB
VIAPVVMAVGFTFRLGESKPNSDGNAVQIVGSVKAALSSFKLPPGVVLKKWYDQSELVVQSATSVRDAVLIGVVLAGSPFCTTCV